MSRELLAMDSRDHWPIVIRAHEDRGTLHGP